MAMLQPAYADLKKAPPSFSHGGNKVVWADFLKAEYKLVFDIEKKTAKSISEIEFVIEEKGFPIFDSVNEVDELYINNKLVTQSIIETPGKETKLRLIGKSLVPGKYKMTVYSSIKLGVLFKKDSVSAGFFMKDMKDREFLERYLPSNLEYDQYQIKLNLKIIGSKVSHRLFTNGKISFSEKNNFEVSYPDFFNSSSLYFHLVPKGKFKVKKSTFKSMDGREIPVTVYSKYKTLNLLVKRKVHKVLKELEKDYGPWPHPQVLIHSNSKLRGGMEYAGAAVSGWFAIGHELQHAYFARAVMPKNGSAGWIDEAIASWRDFFHRSSKKPNFDFSNMGGKSPYVRKTDHSSYKKGRSFMSYLDKVITKETDYCLKDFLKVYFEKRKYTTVDTKTFISDLEEFTGLSFQVIFDQYIFGEEAKVKSKDKLLNPYHLRLSEKELLEMI